MSKKVKVEKQISKEFQMKLKPVPAWTDESYLKAARAALAEAIKNAFGEKAESDPGEKMWRRRGMRFDVAV